MAATAPKMGRPPDMELRDRIEAIHREHPAWSQRQVAAEVGCAWRTVARSGIVPAKAAIRGTRMVIPAELAARADQAGGVLAVLERALAVPIKPAAALRDRWIPGGGS